MGKTTVDDVQREANQGIDALKRRQADQASVHFTKALDHAGDLEDDRTRRDELSTLGALFNRCGFPDLAIMAAEDAVDLDRALALNSLRAQDLLEIGIAHQNLGNMAKAEAPFREALTYFVKENEYANAASASTNLAGIVGSGGDVAGAITLMEQSLAFLAKEAFDDTEWQTRFGLLQAYEVAKGDVDKAAENAKTLCARFWDSIPADQQPAAREWIDQLSERYVNAHKMSGAAAWKAKTFPKVYA